MVAQCLVLFYFYAEWANKCGQGNDQGQCKTEFDEIQELNEALIENTHGKFILVKAIEEVKNKMVENDAKPATIKFLSKSMEKFLTVA